MTKRTISLMLFLSGTVLLILSLTADMIGIGEGNMFGWKQLTGVAVGLIALVAGSLLRRVKAEQKK